MKTTLISGWILVMAAVATAGGCSASEGGGGGDSSSCSDLADVCKTCTSADEAGAKIACNAIANEGVESSCAGAMRIRTYQNACAGGSSGAGGASSGTTGAGKPGSTGSSKDAPKILSFGTSVQSITHGDSVTFTVIVTDPQGIGDVIGGSLEDENGSPYGAFATSSQEGSYQMTISWDDIQHVHPINFASGAKDACDFTAVFYDMEGNRSTQTAVVDLVCRGTDTACDGLCVDTTSNPNHCGACGAMCTSIGPGSSGACEGSTCYPDEVGDADTTAGETCSTYCAYYGEVGCANDCDNPMIFEDASGNTTPVTCDTPVSAGGQLECCCSGVSQ